MKYTKFLSIIILAFTNSCAYVANLRQEYNNSLIQNCDNILLSFRGNVDLVYGLESIIWFECPVLLNGKSITWNKTEEKKIEKDDNKNITIHYGKEYGSVFGN